MHSYQPGGLGLLLLLLTCYRHLLRTLLLCPDPHGYQHQQQQQHHHQQQQQHEVCCCLLLTHLLQGPKHPLQQYTAPSAQAAGLKVLPGPLCRPDWPHLARSHLAHLARSDLAHLTRSHLARSHLADPLNE